MAQQNIDFIFLIGPRACGKSTVAAELGRSLRGWRVVDLDEEFRRRRLGRERTHFDIDPEDYYTGSQRILVSLLETRHMIVALGGGTLINGTVNPHGDGETLQRCRRRGKMVLVLPSRFDFRNRRILYQRECQRAYRISRGSAYRQYNERIGYYRGRSDLIVCGASVKDAGQRIVAEYDLKAAT